MPIYVFPWKSTSEGAKILARDLGATLVSSLQNVSRDDAVLVNWGAGYLPSERWGRYWLNKPTAIETCVNKRLTFDTLFEAGVDIPEYTDSKVTARQWLRQGHIVLERHKLSGMMGEGIKVKQGTDTLEDAKLYVKHVRHDDEYRIHVFKGRVINIGKKFQFSGDANPLIRNWGSWRFTNPDPRSVPAAAKGLGIAAVEALGLDFGAVDLGYKRDGSAYVFEINSAPGTGHNTISRFKEAIKGYANSLTR